MALLDSQDAVAHAEEAFYEPTMVSMLYFPENHKYAMYTPLFGPLIFPLLSALVREIKAFKKLA